MTFEEGRKLLIKMHEEELKVAETKGREYTQGDRLDNFKRIGRELGIDPKVVLWVYLKKHLDSIASFIKNKKVLSEPIQGRIMDARVYLCLLRGLIEEEEPSYNYNFEVRPAKRDDPKVLIKNVMPLIRQSIGDPTCSQVAAGCIGRGSKKSKKS